MSLKKIVLLTLLLIVFRFAILLTNAESVSGTKEELYQGTVAMELIQGLRHPLWDYLADDYGTGALVEGGVAAFFFRLFGGSLFALKLAPFSFHLGAFLLLIYFMRKYFSPRAAFLSALFFIFSPPAFAKMSFLAIGNHPESIFFSMIILIVFSRFFFEGQRRNIDLLFFGLAGGIGVCFTPITLITFVTCLVVWAFSEPRSFWSRKLILLSGSFCLGYLPWIFYNFVHQASGIRSLFHMFIWQNNNAQNFLSRIAGLFFVSLPLSWGFSTSIHVPGLILCYLYFVSVLALIAANARLQKGPISFFLLYPVVFMLFFTLSNADAHSVFSIETFHYEMNTARYFIPLHFFLFGLLGAALAASGFRKAIGILLVLGVLGQSALWGREPFGNIFYYKGYSYQILGLIEGQSWRRWQSRFSDYLNSLQSRPASERYFLIRGLSFDFAEGIALLLKNVPEEGRLSLAEKAGHKRLQNLDFFSKPEEREAYCRGLANGKIENEILVEEDYEKYAEKADLLSPECRQWFYLALGYAAANEPPLTPAMEQYFRQKKIEDLYVSWFYRGAGIRVILDGVFTGLSLFEAIEKIVMTIPEDKAKDLYWGMGWALRQDWAEDRRRGEDWLRRVIPLSHQEEAMRGFEDYENFFQLPG